MVMLVINSLDCDQLRSRKLQHVCLCTHISNDKQFKTSTKLCFSQLFLMVSISLFSPLKIKVDYNLTKKMPIYDNFGHCDQKNYSVLIRTHIGYLLSLPLCCNLENSSAGNKFFTLWTVEVICCNQISSSTQLTKTNWIRSIFLTYYRQKLI